MLSRFATPCFGNDGGLNRNLNKKFAVSDFIHHRLIFGFWQDIWGFGLIKSDLIKLDVVRSAFS